jgi:homoserine kinase
MLHTCRSRAPSALRFVVGVPSYTLATSEARAALPATYPAASAVFNVQRAAGLVAAFPSLVAGSPPEGTDRAAMRELFRDRMHQTQREPLLPGFRSAADAAEAVPGCIAACLSGAGPTLLAVADSGYDEVAAAIVRGYAAAGIDAVTHVLNVDYHGARYC